MNLSILILRSTSGTFHYLFRNQYLRKMKLSIAFFSALVYILCVNADKPGVSPRPHKYTAPVKHALLVSISNGWSYYRHQSSLYHAYQTLIQNGFPSKDIITMFFDDIAQHPKNKEPGVVRNHPKGPNVYEGVKKDYTGKDVNADTFIGVLTENKTLTKGGPVISSTGPHDTLFVYIVGMGTWKYLPFPNGKGISAVKFVDLFEDLREDKKFDKIFINLDCSFGASLVQGLVSTDDKIFISSSTSMTEYPPAAYCNPQKRLCHSSLFGAIWTEYSDRLRQLKSGATKTVGDIFNKVRAEIGLSHVNYYGDISVTTSKLQEFIGYKFEGKSKNEPKVGFGIGEEESVKSMDPVQNYILKSDPELFDENQHKEKRNFILDTMKQIFNKLQLDGYKNIVHHEKLENMLAPLSNEHSSMYETSIQHFNDECFNINKNPYTLREVPKLAYLCEMGVSLEDQRNAMKHVCNSEHRGTSDVY